MKLKIQFTFVGVAADNISKYKKLKPEFDKNKINQNLTNIQLDDMFT